MFTPLRACTYLLLVAALSCLVERAAAQDTGPEQEARSLFQRGLEASDAHRWSEAADFFERSSELVARPNTLFNLVGVLYRLGRYRDGLQVAGAYLAGPAEPGGSEEGRDKRAEVERLRVDMQLAVGVVRVQARPRTAEVSVDGERVTGSSEQRELVLDPGRHELLVQAAGHESQRQPFVMERGGRVVLEVTLLPLAQLSEPPSIVLPADEAQLKSLPPQAVDQAPTPRQRRLRRALWITGSLLLAGGLAGLIVASQPEPARPQPTGGTLGITLDL